MKEAIKVENLVLGAGIAGLGAGYELRRRNKGCVIIEKNDSYGGLLDNFVIDGFRFDKFIHLSFTKSEEVRRIFDKTPYHTHNPLSYNYYKGYWLKHPAQNNIYPLPSVEKQKIIDGFDKRPFKTIEEIKDYDEWLRVQYGDYFAENFPLVYTKKYWTVDAKDLETNWIGSRMYKPSVEEIKQGAETSETPNTYYAKEMRYPKEGGYKSFLKPLRKGLDIRFNQKVVEIDTMNKIVETISGDVFQYENLINTMPLPELIALIKDVPSNVKCVAKSLRFTSGAVISLGFNKPELADKLWYYIYDQDIPPARVYSPSLKSPDNCPEGCSSIQAEYYFNWETGVDLTEILDRTIEKFTQMNLFSHENLVVKDIRLEKYANVMFDHGIYKNRSTVLKFLEANDILSAGRFGEWDYFWSDQSLLSGMKAARKVTYDNINTNS